MGNYTELGIDIHLKPIAEIGEDIHVLLQRLCNQRDDLLDLSNLSTQVKLETLPHHPFWHTDRFTWLGARTGYSEDGEDVGAVYAHPLLKIRCNVKNYHSVLQRFLDWITPYVESVEDGRYKYEEDWGDTDVTLGTDETGASRFVMTTSESSRNQDYGYGYGGYDNGKDKVEFVPKFTMADLEPKPPKPASPPMRIAVVGDDFGASLVRGLIEHHGMEDRVIVVDSVPEELMRGELGTIEGVTMHARQKPRSIDMLDSMLGLMGTSLDREIDRMHPRVAMSQCNNCSKRTPDAPKRWCSEFRHRPSQCSLNRPKQG